MFKTIEPELCNPKLEKEDIKMCIGRCDGPSGIPDTYVCFRQVAFFNVWFFITHSFKISSEYRIRTVYSHFGPVFFMPKWYIPFRGAWKYENPEQMKEIGELGTANWNYVFKFNTNIITGMDLWKKHMIEPLKSDLLRLGSHSLWQDRKISTIINHLLFRESFNLWFQ